MTLLLPLLYSGRGLPWTACTVLGVIIPTVTVSNCVFGCMRGIYSNCPLFVFGVVHVFKVLYISSNCCHQPLWMEGKLALSCMKSH